MTRTYGSRLSNFSQDLAIQRISEITYLLWRLLFKSYLIYREILADSYLFVCITKEPQNIA